VAGESVPRLIRARSENSLDWADLALDKPGWLDATPAWLDELTAWIAARVEFAGPVSLKRRRRRPWSVVGGVSTPTGRVWFKEVGPGMAFEPALTATLARHVPHYLPQIVAAEGSRLLTAQAGRRLDRVTGIEPAAPIWTMIASRYAEFQIETASIADLPAPDSRPETLARRFGDQVDPLVAALGDAVPPSLVHLDVSHKNVCVRDGGPVFLDWSAGTITHPFCGLVKTLRVLVASFGAEPGGPEVRRVRDAYLEPWTTCAPPKELRRIFAAAYTLRSLCRAAAWERILAPYPHSVHERFGGELEKCLVRFTEALRVPARLGA
jgi:hypothetical protein